MIITDSCEWADPGRSPYTGTREAAIMAMAPIPLDARRRLAARAPASYDHFVVVDRDSVRTKGAAFEREVSFMNFGNGGRICGDVQRQTWSPEHVETAIVYCDAISGYCVGTFAVCNNWSIFTMTPKAESPPPPRAEGPPSDQTPPAVASPPPALLTPPEPDLPSEGPPTYFGGGGGGGFYGGGGGGGGGFYGGGEPCCYCPPEGIPSPVPEPETYALLLAGFGLTWLYRRRQRK